ncbi:MAG: nucleotidyltransferase family protein [Bdellovibrionales bacterium]|nr:nucleotidyltransferase family protein [Bdellovibrionales bacterium]
MKLTVEDVIKILNENNSEIKNFGVKEIYLFGSVARGEATEKSDVDFFIDFGPEGADFFTLYDLEKFLTSKLKTKVDLGTKNSLHPLLKDKILKEALRVA